MLVSTAAPLRNNERHHLLASTPPSDINVESNESRNTHKNKASLDGSPPRKRIFIRMQIYLLVMMPELNYALIHLLKLITHPPKLKHFQVPFREQPYEIFKSS